MGDREGKYLTFSLADEEYGIGILKIKEIIGMLTITSVPQIKHFTRPNMPVKIAFTPKRI